MLSPRSGRRKARSRIDFLAIGTAFEAHSSFTIRRARGKVCQHTARWFESILFCFVFCVISKFLQEVYRTRMTNTREAPKDMKSNHPRASHHCVFRCFCGSKERTFKHTSRSETLLGSSVIRVLGRINHLVLVITTATRERWWY
jgi:hypothetical protein